MRYYCNICKKDITKAEFLYSIDKFDRPLCRYHQDIERNKVNEPVQEEPPIPDTIEPETPDIYEEEIESELEELEEEPKSGWKSIVKKVATKTGKGIVKGVKKMADYSKKTMQIRRWKDDILRRMTMNQLRNLCFQKRVSTKKKELRENRSGETYWKELNCTKSDLVSRLKNNVRLDDIIAFAKRNHINIRDILADINRKKAEWKIKELTEKLNELGNNPLVELEKAIHEFIPHRYYDKEFYYQDTLASFLKSKFENTEIEVSRGSTRPDIVVDGIAIEVKGPTSNRDLESIPNKCLLYPRHFPNGMICVLFKVQVSNARYNDFVNRMNLHYPEVIIIRK